MQQCQERPKENTWLCILWGVFTCLLTMSPSLAQTYHFHVYMSPSRPTVPIKSILELIFHYKFQRGLLNPGVITAVYRLQEKLLVSITDFVPMQQLWCWCQPGALGLASPGVQGKGLVSAGLMCPAVGHQTWAVRARVPLESLQLCGRGL